MVVEVEGVSKRVRAEDVVGMNAGDDDVWCRSEEDNADAREELAGCKVGNER